MQKITFTFLSLFFIIFSTSRSFCQNTPTIEFDRTLGGSQFENFTSLTETSDGGYILGGISSSAISGDKSENSKGSIDYWIVKIDASGNKLWDKTIGGNSVDVLYSLTETSDGGYILGGYSDSNISGDKSENSKGDYDYWVVKIDASGNKLWDKTLGGSSTDILISLTATSDGGYILGGSSYSAISGDKSENSKGSNDYWIVKIDASGNKLWDKTIGGNANDFIYSLTETADGGYILGGNSNSNISGDKSENSKGRNDYWVVKIDASGNKLWDKTIGGNFTDILYSLTETSDGAYILGGYSESNISGDKSENSKGYTDYWVVKIDASGNKLWDKTIGGSSTDFLYSLTETADGGYILGGNSNSNISGDKSENSKGDYDYWVVKIDASGNKLWDKTIGGSSTDIFYSLTETSDGGYILGGYSDSNISGDKSENSKGGNDYWIVKLKAKQTIQPDQNNLPDITAECEINNLTAPEANNGDITASTETKFPVTQQGTTLITWVYDDGNGNTLEQEQKVILEDKSSPNLTPVEDRIENLDENCEFLLPDLTHLTTASDNCSGEIILSQSPTPNTVLTGVDMEYEIILTATDTNGLTNETKFKITLKDSEGPSLTPVSDFEVELTQACDYSIPDFTNLTAATDNCGVNVSLSQSPAVGTLVSGHDTTQKIEITAVDESDNASNISFTITLKDKVAPMLTEVVPINESLNENCQFIVPDYTGFTKTSDNCGNVIVTQEPAVGTVLSGHNTTHQIILTGDDGNGNTSQTSFEISLQDDTNPTVLTQDITVQLNASGTATIVPADIDKGSNDACGIANLALDVTSFDCSNVGPNTVTLTVTDNNQNTSTATATVTVEDNVDPVAITQDITVQLNASGTATIVPADIDNGSNDACGIAGLALDATSFDCSKVGPNTVTLTVTDNNQNTSTATAMVTVEDNVDPVAITQDVTVQLNASGTATIVPADIDNGSNDACGIQSLALDVTSFDCSKVGPNTVTLTVTDNNQNTSTATATVTVEDNVAPVAITQDIPVQLNTSGTAAITAADVDNGSNDACGIAGLALDVTSFDCSKVGPNTVTLTVTDNNQNTSTATATVTVEDNVDPVAITQDITVQLNASGSATITAADVDNGSNDACGIAGLALDVTSFDCSKVGPNTVTLTVTDKNQNTSTATATVTVEDNVDPVAITQDITVQLNASGTATIVPADIDNGSNDACGIQSLALDVTSFDCSKVGPNTVTLTVTDNNQNTSTATATVTVEDNVDPVAIAKDISIDLDDTGNASIVASQIDNGSYDNCSIAEFNLSKYDFSCADVGDNSVTLTVKDPSGNSDSVIFTVKVNKFKPVTSISVDPGSQQYSDQVTFTAIIENGYCDTAQQAATEVKFYVGNELMGTSALVVTGTDLVGTLTTELLEKISGSMAPGVKEVKAVFDNIDTNYDLDSPNTELTVTQEDAIVEYTGQSLQATRGANDSETTVLLTATIQDIAVSSGNDNFEGDIRNAKVKFVDRDSGADISGWLTVNLIDASDITTGSASFAWTVDIGNFDSESFTLGILVDNGYYLRNSSEDNTVITVYKPVGDFITGGGSIYPSNSSGIYATTDGLKTNFGFNVKYNKKGNKLKGHTNVVFRRIDAEGQIRTYQIKGNAIQSLGVNVNDQDNQTATFITKSNLTDITDSNNPISLGGNLYLKVGMTDRGEPGTDDSIAITLTESDGTLLYSSEWNGLSTDEMTLTNGNLVVKSGFSLENDTSLETENISMNTLTKEIKSLDLIVSPNPTTDYFTATVITENKKDRVELFVYSYAGSLIYSAKGKANDKFTFGSRFETGTYIVKLFQAGQTVEKIVIKK